MLQKLIPSGGQGHTGFVSRHKDHFKALKKITGQNKLMSTEGKAVPYH